MQRTMRRAERTRAGAGRRPSTRSASQQPGHRPVAHDLLLALQQSAGNAAVHDLLVGARASGEPPGPVVQRMVFFEGRWHDEQAMPLEDLEGLVERIRRNEHPMPKTLTRLEEVLATRRQAESQPSAVPPPPPQVQQPPQPSQPPPVPQVQSPSPSPSPSSVPAPSPAQTKFEPYALTKDNVDLVLKELTSWGDYASGNWDAAWDAWYDLKQQKEKLGSAYYDPANSQFRQQCKDAHRRVIELSSTKGEVRSVKTGIEEAKQSQAPDRRYRSYHLLYSAGALVAVVEWGPTPEYIANIVSSPKKVGGGVAKAVIALTILRSRAEGRREKLELVALTNLVKKIYANYLFKVYDEKKDMTIERQSPLREGTKVQGKKGLVPEKTEWHHVKTMILTPEAADEFLSKRKPQEVLEIPQELVSLLPS